MQASKTIQSAQRNKFKQNNLMPNQSPKSKRSSKSAKRQNSKVIAFGQTTQTVKIDINAAKNHKFSLDFTKLTGNQETQEKSKSPLPSGENIMYNKYKHAPQGLTSGNNITPDPLKQSTLKNLKNAYSDINSFTSRRGS